MGKMDPQASVGAVAHKFDEIRSLPDVIAAKDDGLHRKCRQIVKDPFRLDRGEDGGAAAIRAARHRIPRHDWSIVLRQNPCPIGGLVI